MKAGTCKHFRGIQHDTCLADQPWRKITGGERVGIAKRMPCIKSEFSTDTCDLYTEPTEKEIEESNAWIEQAIANIKEAAPLISKLKEEFKDVGGYGTRNCPVCGNIFHFTVAECNGHVHGKCETTGCLRFME